MRLWRNQAFAVFWSARTISFTGTGITIVVLPVLVYGMTHSPAWVASLSLIESVPYLGLGRAAVRADDRGRVADRHEAAVRTRLRCGVLPHLGAAAAIDPAAFPAATA